MQLIELNLRAYGPFTNLRFRFEPQGRSGLHLIFGANEAGKSTMLRGLRNVLFGMDTRDAHVHPPDFLQVGLGLRTGAGEHLEVERRKGKGLRSLIFQGSGKPVPVEAWERVLPVKSAELFDQMFGIDYDRLLQGDRNLAVFKGEIGQALLAAAGDLGQAAAEMEQLQQRADEIYAPQASSRPMNRAIREMKEAEARIRTQKFTSTAYKAAVTLNRELGEGLAQIERELSQHAEERTRLTRFQTAAPHVARLVEDQAELQILSDAILLTPGFEQRFTELTRERSLAAARQAEAQAELERLNSQLSNIHRLPELSTMLPKIDGLKEQAGQIEAARRDLPKRNAQYQERQAHCEKLCLSLGARPENLPQITIEVRRRIETLSTDYLKLRTMRGELPTRIASLERRALEAEVKLAELSADFDPTELNQSLGQIPKRKQSGAETKRLRQEHDDLRSALNRDVSAFPLWNGTADQLEILGVPLAASTSEMQARFAKQNAREEQAVAETQRLDQECARCVAALGFLEQRGGIPTVDELTTARARRDLGWSAIKERWLRGVENGSAEEAFLGGDSEPLPDKFETAVALADSLADRLRLEADRVEQKRNALDDLARSERKLNDHHLLLEQIQWERAELDADWKALWAESEIEPRTPREMAGWLEERKALIERVRDLRRASGLLSEAELEEKAWRESLAKSLSVSAEQTLAELVAKAEARISQSDRIRSERTELNIMRRQAKSDLQGELENERKNESDLTAWSERWVDAIAQLPVSKTAEPSAIQDVINVIGEVKSASDTMNDLQHRIDAMKQDEVTYEDGVQTLALTTAQLDLLGLDAVVAIGRLQERAREARDNERTVKQIVTEQKRREQELAKATSDIQRFTVAVDELLKVAHVNSGASIPEVIQRSNRKAALTEQIRGHLKALAGSAGTMQLQTFMSEIQATNVETLKARIEELEQKVMLLDQAKAEKTREQERIQNEFRLRQDAAEVRSALSWMARST